MKELIKQFINWLPVFRAYLYHIQCNIFDSILTIKPDELPDGFVRPIHQFIKRINYIEDLFNSIKDFIAAQLETDEERMHFINIIQSNEYIDNNIELINKLPDFIESDAFQFFRIYQKILLNTLLKIIRNNKPNAIRLDKAFMLYLVRLRTLNYICDEMQISVRNLINKNELLDDEKEVD